MTIKIHAPHGCCTSFILFDDIIRVENRSFSFFEACTYNLYITMKGYNEEEHFSLFSYHQEKDMQLAYDTIASLLKQASNTSVILEMVPMSA